MGENVNCVRVKREALSSKESLRMFSKLLIINKKNYT